MKLLNYEIEFIVFSKVDSKKKTKTNVDSLPFGTDFLNSKKEDYIFVKICKYVHIREHLTCNLQGIKKTTIPKTGPQNAHLFKS